MTYRVQQNSLGRFDIVDTDGDVLFSGPLSACESWLDQQEGAQQRTWMQMLGEVLSKLAGRAATAATSPEQKPAP